MAWLAEWHKYAECKIWPKNGAKKYMKLKNMRASLPRLLLAPIWVGNNFAGPFITAGLNQQGRAESSDKIFCIRFYVI